MARTPKGILGAVEGRIGPVTGYSRNGQYILRSAHTRHDGKITPGRTAQREKIKLTNSFTKAFTGTGFFNRTFPATEGGSTGYNRATAAIMGSAVQGEYPNMHLSYPDILIAKGTLPHAQNATVKKSKNSLLFTWNHNTLTRGAKSSDNAVLVAYIPASGIAIFSIGAATRNEGTATLAIAAPKGTLVQTWLSFLSPDEANAANSIHTGTITI